MWNMIQVAPLQAAFVRLDGRDNGASEREDVWNSPPRFAGFGTHLLPGVGVPEGFKRHVDLIDKHTRDGFSRECEG